MKKGKQIIWRIACVLLCAIAMLYISTFFLYILDVVSLKIRQRPQCRYHNMYRIYIVTSSSNGDILRVTGPLWGETTGHGSIPLTKASDAELWCFPWSAPEQTVEQALDHM